MQTKIQNSQNQNFQNYSSIVILQMLAKIEAGLVEPVRLVQAWLIQHSPKRICSLQYS